MEDSPTTLAGPSVPVVPSIDEGTAASTSSHDPTPFTSAREDVTTSQAVAATDLEDTYEESCWICMEPAPADPSASPDWVHPCKCSLVAHQQCLLVWVNARQPLGREPMKCPQCQTVYKYSLPKGASTHFAHVLEHLDDLIGVPPMIIALHTIPTALGYSSLRLFLGEDGTRVLLGGKGVRSWCWGAFFVLPALPIALWFYELKSLSRKAHLLRLSNIPYLFFPWLPLALVGRYVKGPRAALLKVDGKWPPGPVVTLAGLQLLNIIYPLFRKRINTLIFSTPLSSTSLPFPLHHVEPNDGDDVDGDPALPNFPARSILWKLARPLMNGCLNPVVGWGVGVELRWYFNRGTAPSWGKKLLGVDGLGGVGGWRLRSREETWRGRVRPDWWYCAVGGCLVAVIRDTFRLTARYIRVRQMRSRTVRNYSESQTNVEKETIEAMLRAMNELNDEELRYVAEEEVGEGGGREGNEEDVVGEVVGGMVVEEAEEGEAAEDGEEEEEIVVVQVPDSSTD